MPWHHRERHDDRTKAAARAPSEPVVLGTLQPGDKFETLHTKLIGKVVECLGGEDGVKVVLYIPGKGWLARTLHHSCIMKQRE